MMLLVVGIDVRVGVSVGVFLLVLALLALL